MKAFRETIIGIFVLPLVCAIFSGCSGLSSVKDIKITSCGLESCSLRGLRSVDAVLAVGIDNPAFAFKVMDVSGVVKYNGEDLATYTADTISVDRKCSKVYEVPCSATLSDGVGLMKLMRIAKEGGLDGFTTDVTATVKLRNGAGKTFSLKNIDLGKIVE